MDITKILKEYIEQVRDVGFHDQAKFDKMRKRGVMLISNLKGENSSYIIELKNIRFYPSVYPTTTATEHRVWNAGKESLINLVTTILEEEALFGSERQKKSGNQNIDNKNIFIVHGHDDKLKLEVSSILSKLHLNPIILSEQPNEGKTIIEKFEKHSDVGFAIILLTGDDKGKISDSENEQIRARQNVILEMGYFIGKLDRNRVFPLYERGVELPSDLHGLVYNPIESEGWKFNLVKELKTAGYKVDANNII